MKKYIINGQELYPANQVLPDNDSFELRTKFNNLLEALGTPVPEPKKEFKRWRAEENETYWFITDVDSVCDDLEEKTPGDDFRYDLGNYYQTEELAQKALDKQIALTKLNDIILEKNEGWVADWSDEEQLKIAITFDRFDRKANRYYCWSYVGMHINPFILPIKNIEIGK